MASEITQYLNTAVHARTNDCHIATASVEASTVIRRASILSPADIAASGLFHFYFINEVIKELTIQSQETMVRTVSGFVSNVLSPSAS